MMRCFTGPATVLASILLSLLILPGVASAGPNLGGTLVAHETGLAYTSDVPIYPSMAPDSCSFVDAEAPVGVPADGQGWVWKIYAAFPRGSSPRLKALAFGSTWDPSVVQVVAGGLPDPYWDFEIAQDGWPTEPNRGVGVSFHTTKTALLSEVYWMAGYAYTPGQWRLWPHPVQEMIFVDDNTPPQSDPITALSTLGFGQPGERICPTVVGACCFANGDCVVMGREACLAAGGVEWGGYVGCDPDPCVYVPGACCQADGTCLLLNGLECLAAGGSFQGEGTDCTPNPCPLPTGACCYASGFCDMRNQPSCQAVGGSWQGPGTDCTPNPCPQPVLGACCLPTGACTLVNGEQCAQYGGDYLGDGTTCLPQNPCPQPPPQGACCLPNGACLMRTEEQCTQQGGSWLGIGTDCNPNPCPQPLGACCLPDGSCLIETSGGCATLGGSWLGMDTSCEPNPCIELSGACCFPDGSCAVLPFTDCSGIFLANQDCEPNPCGMFIGACCFYDGSCLVMPESDCFASGGWFWWPGESCEPNPCDNSTPVEKTSWGRIKRSYF